MVKVIEVIRLSDDSQLLQAEEDDSVHTVERRSRGGR